MALAVSYLDIKDIFATPNNTWYAQNSTDSGNNMGWTFAAGGVVIVYNTVIQDSQAQGPTLWIAYVSDGNINGGNNTGWLFNPPNSGGAMAMFYP